MEALLRGTNTTEFSLVVNALLITGGFKSISINYDRLSPEIISRVAGIFNLDYTLTNEALYLYSPLLTEQHILTASREELHLLENHLEYDPLSENYLAFMVNPGEIIIDSYPIGRNLTTGVIADQIRRLNAIGNPYNLYFEVTLSHAE